MPHEFTALLLGSVIDKPLDVPGGLDAIDRADYPDDIRVTGTIDDQRLHRSPRLSMKSAVSKAGGRIECCHYNLSISI